MVLRQQVNEDVLVDLAPRQGVVGDGHLPVGEVVGQAAAGDPERLAAGGLGDLGPILIHVEEGGSPEHHGGGSQGAGPSLFLFEEDLVLVDFFIGGSQGRGDHHCQHQHGHCDPKNPLSHPISPLFHTILEIYREAPGHW